MKKYLLRITQHTVLAVFSLFVAMSAIADSLPRLSEDEAEKHFMKYKGGVSNARSANISGEAGKWSGTAETFFEKAKRHEHSREVTDIKYGKDKAVAYIFSPNIEWNIVRGGWGVGPATGVTTRIPYNTYWRIVFAIDVDRWSIVSVELERAVPAGQSSMTDNSRRGRQSFDNTGNTSSAPSMPTVKLTKEDVRSDPFGCGALVGRKITVIDITQQGTTAFATVVCENDKWISNMRFTYVLQMHEGKPMWMYAGEKFISEKRK